MRLKADSLREKLSVSYLLITGLLVSSAADGPSPPPSLPPCVFVDSLVFKNDLFFIGYTV